MPAREDSPDSVRVLWAARPAVGQLSIAANALHGFGMKNPLYPEYALVLFAFGCPYSVWNNLTSSWAASADSV